MTYSTPHPAHPSQQREKLEKDSHKPLPSAAPKTRTRTRNASSSDTIIGVNTIGDQGTFVIAIGSADCRHVCYFFFFCLSFVFFEDCRAPPFGFEVQLTQLEAMFSQYHACVSFFILFTKRNGISKGLFYGILLHNVIFGVISIVAYQLIAIAQSAAPPSSQAVQLKQNTEKLTHTSRRALPATAATITPPQSAGGVLIFAKNEMVITSEARVETDTAAIGCGSGTIFREQVVFGERAHSKHVCFCFIFCFAFVF